MNDIWTYKQNPPSGIDWLVSFPRTFVSIPVCGGVSKRAGGDQVCVRKGTESEILSRRWMKLSILFPIYWAITFWRQADTWGMFTATSLFPHDKLINHLFPSANENLVCLRLYIFLVLIYRVADMSVNLSLHRRILKAHLVTTASDCTF